ncbi:OLC1v1034408C1 [Oldenlandia corymbosa var. corymbosa]|uniref:OLC1v1034408C1 n=1 Tax=Oldenlandia corymbosa var. corymbosa TaxID=529605 RepID=A0AAV1CTD2_OLDCO|nr:OLC1v1034408C1 [Oldenlandia corymbosa var. corymbosa]
MEYYCWATAGDDRGVEAAMRVGDRGVEVDMASGDRVVETATAFSDRGKALIPPEWRNDDWIDDMLSSDRVMSYLVEDSSLINVECSGSKSIEQSYCASKSTQGHSFVVDPLQSEVVKDDTVPIESRKGRLPGYMHPDVLDYHKKRHGHFPTCTKDGDVVKEVKD